MTPSPLLDDSSSRSAILSESFRQSEDFSQYTGSSSSTIWGPGALAGKALKACGELALRAWDDIKIRRRLSTLDAQFPDKPSFFILEDDPMYEDLLELSRSGMYDFRIRRHALEIILRQVAAGHNHGLVQKLKKWPQTELQIFLTELMTCLPEEWVDAERKRLHLQVRDAYLHSPAHRKAHSASGLITFIIQLASDSDSSYPAQAIIAAGFLDMLTLMALSEFPDPSPFQADNSPDTLRQNKFVLQRKCNEALMLLSSHTATHRVLTNHPLCAFWPSEHWSTLTAPCFLQRSPEDWTVLRRSFLKDIKLRVLERRLRAVNEVVDHVGSNTNPSSVVLACTDLVHMCRSPAPVSHGAFVALLKCVALGGDIWRILKCTLDALPHEDARFVIAGIVQALDESMVLPSSSNRVRFGSDLYPIDYSSSAASEYIRLLSRNKDVHPIDYFLEFSISLAQEDPVLGQALLDTNIVSLLLSVLNDLFHDPYTNLLNISMRQRRTLLDIETSRLHSSLLADGRDNVWTGGLEQSRSLALMLALLLSLLTESSNDDWNRRTITRSREAIANVLPDVETSALLASSRRKVSGDYSTNPHDDHLRLLVCFQMLSVLFDAQAARMSKGVRESFS